MAPGSLPASRAGAACAYDAARATVILFGGRNASTLHGDTWQWDGTNWLQKSPTTVPPAREQHRLVYDSARQRVVMFGGNGAGNTMLNDTWEWDGTNWTFVALPASPTPRHYYAAAFDTARARTVLFGGHVVGGGDLGDTWEYGATDPATSIPFGAGCPSAGGTNTLTAMTMPWVNQVFEAIATGLPTTALLLTVTSVTPVLPGFPLDQVFSQGVPGCNLFVAPDILGVLFTTTGTAQSQFFLPNTPPLVGVTFYHQMIPIELDGAGAWIAITATNALQLTAGVL
jgi:hypothetical protein